MKRNSVGFTLIELLVVIAIIAILAAILFPVFTRAKVIAQTSSCASNIKQVGVAMQLYTDSNDGRLPPYALGRGPQRLLWSEFIKPYLKADRTYRCPALPPYVDRTGDFDLQRTARVFGFGVPYPHLFDPDTTNGKQSVKLSAIPRTSRTALMCDSYAMTVDWSARRMVEAGFPVVYCRACQSFGNTYELPDGNIAGRHGGHSDVPPYGKTTVLYCDLHAKAIDKEKVMKRYTTAAGSENYDMWGHFDNIEH